VLTACTCDLSTYDLSINEAEELRCQDLLHAPAGHCGDEEERNSDRRAVVPLCSRIVTTSNPQVIATTDGGSGAGPAVMARPALPRLHSVRIEGDPHALVPKASMMWLNSVGAHEGLLVQKQPERHGVVAIHRLRRVAMVVIALAAPAAHRRPEEGPALQVVTVTRTRARASTDSSLFDHPTMKAHSRPPLFPARAQRICGGPPTMYWIRTMRVRDIWLNHGKRRSNQRDRGDAGGDYVVVCHVRVARGPMRMWIMPRKRNGRRAGRP